MPTLDFKLPTNTRNAIQKRWKCTLTEDTIAQLEGAATRVIFMLAPPRASDEESARAKRDVKAARRRHATIAKAANDLLQLLYQDEKDLPPVTLRRKAGGNVLERIVQQSTMDDAISSMRNLVRLANRPYPAWIEVLTAPKKSRSKNPVRLYRDVWNGFIRDLMVIYLSQTGKLPTLTRSEHADEGYSSPFFSGLSAIHDVLPDDVRRTVSERTLGSRATQILKKHRGGLKGMRSQIQQQQKKAASSA